MSEGHWIVIVEGAPQKRQRDREWRSDPVSFFEARRIAQRACKERDQPATIRAATGRKSKLRPVEIHHPDGRIERPREP